jgi:quercetin dioxygenase-like cupin family protein
MPSSPSRRTSSIRRARPAAGVALAVALLFGAAACGDEGPASLVTTTTAGATAGGHGADGHGPAEGEVQRLDLSDAAPERAPGQHLYLQEVVIGPHTALGLHRHDGMQIANVRSGVLTYHVISGFVEITRLDGTVETVTAPTITEILAGESVVERADTVHYGENLTDGEVVITLAALVTDGGPVSTPVAG